MIQRNKFLCSGRSAVRPSDGKPLHNITCGNALGYWGAARASSPTDSRPLMPGVFNSRMPPMSQQAFSMPALRLSKKKKPSPENIQEGACVIENRSKLKTVCTISPFLRGLNISSFSPYDDRRGVCKEIRGIFVTAFYAKMLKMAHELIVHTVFRIRLFLGLERHFMPLPSCRIATFKKLHQIPAVVDGDR